MICSPHLPSMVQLWYSCRECQTEFQIMSTPRANPSWKDIPQNCWLTLWRIQSCKRQNKELLKMRRDQGAMTKCKVWFWSGCHKNGFPKWHEWENWCNLNEVCRLYYIDTNSLAWITVLWLCKMSVSGRMGKRNSIPGNFVGLKYFQNKH